METEKLSIDYERVQGGFELAAKHVKDLISKETADFKIQDIQHRVKSVDSFVKKALKCKSDGSLKYDDPFNQITDFSGVRLICFLKKDVDPICKKILEIFNTDNIEDVGERVFQKGRFGYQSKHILVKLQKSMYLNSCEYIKEVVCEVQVRTLLQHSWAEMEHDIQYKGEVVPDSLRKRFAALAGLLEIADGEFERIQQDSDSLRSVVEDELLSRLTAEGFAERKVADGQDSSDSSRSARDLIAAGEYEKALSVFNEKISEQPSAYTLFIGRAKVRFLLGDSTGAITDLDTAAKYKPDDIAINNLRKLIEGGNVDYVRNTSAAQQIDINILNEAHNLMKAGKGKEAFEIYTNLEDIGYSKPFSYINRAFCCLLETDYMGAKEYLSKLIVNVGTPMSINIATAKYFIALMENKEQNETLNELNILAMAVPHFEMAISPIDNFLSGLKTRNAPLHKIAMKDLSAIRILSKK